MIDCQYSIDQLTYLHWPFPTSQPRRYCVTSRRLGGIAIPFRSVSSVPCDAAAPFVSDVTPGRRGWAVGAGAPPRVLTGHARRCEHERSRALFTISTAKK
ncbi:hypothetical protein GUJ93_ZPchr0006g41382 [Zizania palustris]|uniref:Uncharacterized protein n=1 Tax=Zizania palustris TaxID=103762 RepID=A0A8J5T893_ZIZPA|nr:hypothetical protein GUJ93_ZPchr0006g41382 [Zizania palustris]